MNNVISVGMIVMGLLCLIQVVLIEYLTKHDETYNRDATPYYCLGVCFGTLAYILYHLPQ